MNIQPNKIIYLLTQNVGKVWNFFPQNVMDDKNLAVVKG